MRTLPLFETQRIVCVVIKLILNIGDNFKGLSAMGDLYKAFHNYFEIVIADTPGLLEEVFRMRYQLLCIDMAVPGYEPSRYPDGLEKDNYDHHSSHALVRYRQSGEFIGTVRLIMFDPTDPEKLFPVERYTQIDPALLDIKKLSRQQTGEISRFMIIKKFERRRAERRNYNTRELIGDIAKADRRSINNLTLVLMAGVVRMCDKYSIRNWFTIMEPALNRLFGYYGLDLNPIGPTTQHYGLRRPYFVELVKVLDRMKRDYRDAWEVVTEKGKLGHFLCDEFHSERAELGD